MVAVSIPRDIPILIANRFRRPLLTRPHALARTISMHWLLKAEPESRIVKGQDVKYTIDDLKKEKVGTWDGVRNNEARKHLMAMSVGDTAFFYRSNCKKPGVVGTMKVVKAAYPDETAKDPKAAYYDAKSPDRWVVVDVEYVSHLEHPVLLHTIKATRELSDMQLVKRSRLSVIPVTDAEWECILKLSKGDQSQETEETQNSTTDNAKSKPVDEVSKKRAANGSDRARKSRKKA